MKKIRKTYSGVVPNGKVLNSRNNSQQDTYSSDYLNRIIPNTNDLGKIVVDDISCKNDFPLLNNFNSAGISITRNNNGTYNVVGTATANIECVIYKNIEDTIIKNGGAYTLSTNQSLPTGVNSRIEFYNDKLTYVRGFLTVINTASNKPTAVANTENATKVRFGLFITSGTTVDIQNLGLQLEEGMVASKFVEHKEFGNKETKSVSLWSGRVYESGSILTLRKPLEIGKIYIIEFYGLSGLYKSYETFIYTGNKYVQLNYYSSPDSTGFRYRLECEGNTITISNESVGTTNNSAITNIYEITSS